MASHGLSFPSPHREGLFDTNALKHLNPGLWRASKPEEVRKWSPPPGKNVTQVFLKNIKSFKLFKLLKVRQKSLGPLFFPLTVTLQPRGCGSPALRPYCSFPMSWMWPWSPSQHCISSKGFKKSREGNCSACIYSPNPSPSELLQIAFVV